jgi:hypothetical protein
LHLLAAAVLWAALAALFVYRLQGRSLDDFFITYRYSQNLAEGNGFVFNPGERVFGTTAPGMGLLLGVGQRLTGIPVHWLGTLSTGIALVAMALLLLSEAVERGRAPEAWLGGSLLVASTFLWACHGAEGMVVLALLLLGARCGVERPLAAGLAAGFAVWCRPDAVVGAGLLGLLLWWEGRRFPRRYVLTAGAVIALGAAAALAYFGQLEPNTWSAKQAHVSGLDAALERAGKAFWPASLPLLHRHLGRTLWPMLVLGLAGQLALLRQAGRPGRLLVLYAAAMFVAYPALGVGFAPWYAIPVLAALLFGIPFAAGTVGRAVASWGKERWPARLAGLLAGLLAGYLAALILFVPVLASIAPKAWSWYQGVGLPLHFEGYRLAGEWIRNDSRPGDAISSLEVGTLAYFSRLPVEDLLGLVTPRSIPFVQARDLEGAFLARPTRYVVERPSLTVYMRLITLRRWFRRSYEEVARFHADTSQWTAVYRLKAKYEGRPLAGRRNR